MTNPAAKAAKQKPHTLSRDSKDKLRDASRVGVEAAMSQLKPFLERKSWVGSTNRYRINTTERLRSHKVPDHSTHLARYIAASAPLHCADGWSFVASAVQAHLEADYHRARHLAYYAELRAAMSILAAEGVGIFRNAHYCIETDGSVPLIPGRKQTHEMAWLALRHWSGLDRAADRLSQVIAPNGRELGDWLDGFGLPIAQRVVAPSWLRTWGLDLKEAAEDQEARNNSSYRPSAIGLDPELTPQESVKRISELWDLLEPAGISFPKLDACLLRLSIERGFFARHGRSPGQEPAAFTAGLNRMFTMLAINDPLKTTWERFLRRIDQPDDPWLVKLASAPRKVNDPLRHLEMIGRAVLLLRIATGSNAVLLASNGIDRQNLEFWWGRLGARRGLWEASKLPTSVSDNWVDVQDAIKEVTAWQTANPTASYQKFRGECANPVRTLTRFELPCLWGYGF